MRHHIVLLCAFLTTGCCAALPKLASKSVPYAAPYAAHAIEESSAEWHDAKRNRDVPVRLYVPADVKSPMPVVIFSWFPAPVIRPKGILPATVQS